MVTSVNDAILKHARGTISEDTCNTPGTSFILHKYRLFIKIEYKRLLYTWYLVLREILLHKNTAVVGKCKRAWGLIDINSVKNTDTMLTIPDNIYTLSLIHI